MSDEPRESDKEVNNWQGLFWLAAILAGIAVILGIWMLTQLLDRSAIRSGANPLVLLIPFLLLIASGLLFAYYAAHRAVDQLEERQRERGGSQAGATALRGALIAGAVYWLQRDLIISALQAEGKTIPFFARVFVLTPIASVILIFGAATLIELMPEDRRPSRRTLAVGLALPLLAIFLVSGCFYFGMM